MESKKLHPNLHVIPYIPGIAEYAAQVREELLNRQDSDFLIAVDLPHGLESQVITATKFLPRISIIVDQLFRGIPIIPTSAPIEAVRSFGEIGTDVRFIDTSLPVTGNLDDYRYFIDQCRLSGVGTVIKKAELYGISPQDLLRSWVDTLHSEKNTTGFCHVTNLAPGQAKPWKSDENISPYLQTRLQYMAIKLQELLSTEIDVVMICSISHVNGILHFLQEPLEPIDDSFVVPSKICSVSENDILNITPEVPYFMYLYELFRDIPVERQKWINSVYCGTERKHIPADTIRRALKYSYNLALTDEDLFPDIYNLVAAAKYCVDDDFAFKVFELLRSYPPAEKSASEFNVTKLLDYDFLPMGNTRSLTLRVSLMNDSHGIRRIKQRIFPPPRSTGYLRFTRTPESLQAERDFMKYMTKRFIAFHKVEEEYCVHEFVSGFEEGIDIRETIRNSHLNKLFVRQHGIENQICYVIDYRSADLVEPLTGPLSANNVSSFQEPLENHTRFCSQRIFFDKNYHWVGLVTSLNNHYLTGIMVAFAGLKKDPIPIMDELSYSRPLESAVLLGIKYSKQVFVFTDYPKEITVDIADLKRVKIFPCSIIPPVIYEKMRSFDILCWRSDDKKGD